MNEALCATLRKYKEIGSTLDCRSITKSFVILATAQNPYFASTVFILSEQGDGSALGREFQREANSCKRVAKVDQGFVTRPTVSLSCAVQDGRFARASKTGSRTITREAASPAGKRT